MTGNLSKLMEVIAPLNSSLEEEEDIHIFDKPEVRAILISLYSIVFVFCFFGNLTVVLVTTFHYRMRTATKLCLCNLAVANLCVSVFCIYQNLSLYLSTNWMFGDFLCKMYHFVNSLSHTASILILVVISVERYVVILHPFKSRRIFTTQRRWILIAMVWLVSAALCSPSFYYMATVQTFDPTGQVIRVHCLPMASSYDFTTAEILQFFLLFLGPLVIISVLYTKMTVFLRARESTLDQFNFHAHPKRLSSGSEENRTKVGGRDSLNRDKPSISKSLGSQIPSGRERSTDRQITEECEGQSSGRGRTSLRSEYEDDPNGDEQKRNGGDEPSSTMSLFPPLKGDRRQNRALSNCSNNRLNAGSQQPHKTVARVVITIIVSFAICNLPYHLRKVYQNYFPNPDLESDLSEFLTPVTFLLMYTNCALNPFLYAFLSKRFRTCFSELLHCRARRAPGRK